MSIEYQTDTATNADNSKIFNAATVNQSDGPFYCQYCGEKLKLSKNINPDARQFRPHFKHQEEDVNNPRKCIYTNSDHRHKLATKVLLESKKIKVPAIGKPNPENPDDPWMLIREAYFIESADVRKEVAIYEDESGDMHYGDQTSHEKMNLFVRPDVVFFDSDGAPLLFVELVHTHKPDKQKVQKFNRIGIDTVQVKIPHTSKEDIEKCFNRSTNVKWVYNHEQANAVYRTPDGKESIELPNVDQDQRKLLEETQACRQARIRNLIRGIKRCYNQSNIETLNHSLNLKYEELRIIQKEIKENCPSLKQELEQNLKDTKKNIDKKSKENIETQEKNLENLLSQKKQLLKTYQEKQKMLNKRSKDLEGKSNELKKKLKNPEEVKVILSQKKKELKEKQEELKKKSEIWMEKSLLLSGIKDNISNLKEKNKSLEFNLKNDLKQKKSSLRSQFEQTKKTMMSSYEEKLTISLNEYLKEIIRSQIPLEILSEDFLEQLQIQNAFALCIKETRRLKLR